MNTFFRRVKSYNMALIFADDKFQISIPSMNHYIYSRRQTTTKKGIITELASRQDEKRSCAHQWYTTRIGNWADDKNTTCKFLF